MRTLAPLLCGLVAVCAPVGCSATSARRAACGAVTREALDPGSIQHVLGTSSPNYLTDPPTSGPHQPSPPITGFRSSAIARPVQVGILEEGHVIVQYHGIPEASVARLKALVAPDVVVAPAVSLPDGQHVVATAWLYKQTCGSVDLAALRTFVRTRSGKGPT